MLVAHVIILLTSYNIKFYLSEFDDGSDWALSKCLTHANRTVYYYLIWSGVQVSKKII
jgi:hypothetical protein